jgi:hypothetical protein
MKAFSKRSIMARVLTSEEILDQTKETQMQKQKHAAE